MIRRFMKYYRPYMHILIWVIVGTFAMAGLDLIFPVVVRELIHDVLPAGDMHRLFIGSGILLVLYIINFAIQYAVQYYGHVMSASIEHDMRRDLFAHIEKLSFHYFDNEKTGQLLSRITSDVTEISELSFRGPNDVLLCGVIMAELIRSETGIPELTALLFETVQLERLLGKGFHKADAGKAFFCAGRDFPCLLSVLPESGLHLFVHLHGVNALRNQ